MAAKARDDRPAAGAFGFRYNALVSLGLSGDMNLGCRHLLEIGVVALLLSRNGWFWPPGTATMRTGIAKRSQTARGKGGRPAVRDASSARKEDK